MADAPKPESDSDLAIVAAIVMVFVLGAGYVSVATVGLADKVTTWLVDRHILVPAAGDPVVTIPNTDGAGLDLVRVVGILLFVAVTAECVIRLFVRHLRRGSVPVQGRR